MASAPWINIKTRWNAACSEAADAMIAAIFATIGLHGFGAAARGRLMLRKAIDEMHRQWNTACGVYNMTATPQNVSQFIQGTFNVPFDMPDSPDGRTLDRAELDKVFAAVSRVLIGRGQFQLTS
jgi:hypothetical protein